MKYKYILQIVTLFVILIGMVSCSQDEQLDGGLSKNTAIITYNAGIKSSVETRATPTTSENFLKNVRNFQVWGYNSEDNTYFSGSQNGNGVVINGDGQGNWTYRSASDMVAWPSSGNCYFYALAPASINNYTISEGNLSYNVPTDSRSQIDVLRASNSYDLNVQGERPSQVNLQFEHILSQIKFKGIIDVKGLDVFVKSITIHNLKNKVSINLENGSDVSQTSDTYANYKINFNNPVEVTSTTSAIDLSGDDNVLMVAPQKQTRWSDNTTTQQADAAHQCYLEIECRIKKDGVYIKGSDTQYVSIFNVFGRESLERGKCYTYTLTFDGGGRSDAISEIKYDVDVTGWVDGKKNNTYAAISPSADGGWWATKNIGAADAADEGYRFAWGELKEKENYTLDNYSLYDSSKNEYLFNDANGGDLEESYDAASAYWGSSFILPSYENCKTLINGCSITADNIDGIPVTKFTSRQTKESIYLVDGDYWTSSYGKRDNISISNNMAWCLSVDKGTAKLKAQNREKGLLIRPFLNGRPE